MMGGGDRPAGAAARCQHGQGRRVGILDIGSNSIRLVMFERGGRTPIPLFNERANCNLGADLGADGRLSDAAMDAALTNIRRFFTVAREAGVERFQVLATAAVRDAVNGADFAERIRQTFHHPVRVLGGEDEGRLAALGVISAFPGASGLVADLGGGSLELVELRAGAPGRSATLPLGALRLAAASAHGQPAAPAAARHLSQVGWLAGAAGQTLYLVGGSGRGLARAHIAATGYPLHVLHGYRLKRVEALRFAHAVARWNGNGRPRRVAGLPRQREAMLPAAATVVAELLRRAGSADLAISAYGLREGSVFEMLGPAERALDPLLDSCAEIGRQISRVPPPVAALMQWLSVFFPRRARRGRRLLQAVCHLSDIAWAEHPDYRGEHGFLRVLRLPVVGLEHRERVFLALAILARYDGGIDKPVADAVRRLVSDRRAGFALRVGVVLRLALTLSAGSAGLLRRIRVRAAGPGFLLEVDPAPDALAGQSVDRRLRDLADLLDQPVRLVAAPNPRHPAADSQTLF